MKHKKRQKTLVPPSPTAATPVSYDSMRSASAGMGFTVAQLKKAKGMGAPGFRGSRIYPGELLPWMETHAKELAEITGKDEADLEKRMQEIRKLRIANDAKEGRLVERAWVAERIQRMAGELNSFRAKSEAEHPMRFAAANGDVAQCRTIVRGVWDEILSGMQTLKKHLEEPT